MRVGNSTYYRNTLNNVLNLQREQARLGKEVDTGNRVNAPSDDSAYAPTILTSRYALEQVKQYRTNLETAQNWLKASETSMTSMVERLTRARTLAEQMSNGTYTPAQYPSVASELQRIINDLMVLANSNSNGSYIFAGTSGNIQPVSKNLVMAQPAVMRTLGHGTSSLIYDTTMGGGPYSLRLGRTDSGLYSTLQIAAGNTLGQNLGLDFSRDNWTVIRQAGANQGQLIENNQTFASAASLVSNKAGESFSWLADQNAGWQTFRTWATVSGSGDIDIHNGDTPPTYTNYTFTNAQELITKLNASGDKRFTAVLDSSNNVRIISCGNPIDIQTSNAGVTLDQNLTLQNFNDSISNGINAQGTFTIDDSNPLTFPPRDDDYVRLGDIKVTWGEIKDANAGNPFATSGDYATALRDYLQSHTGQFNCQLIPNPPGSGAVCLQIDAAVPGKAGNVVIESSGFCTQTSGNLYGGLDPMGGGEAAPGHIYGSGHSNLNISTTIKGQVLEVRNLPDGSPETVVVALNWVDDNGKNQHIEVELRNGGESGKINIPELGPDFYIYRDNQSFKLGDTFDIKLGYLQGNTEDLNTNYSERNELRYNWNARQVLGDNMRMDLRGVETVPRNANSGNGLISLSGFYHGLYAQQNMTFDIIDGGELENGMVLVRASWTDENGQPKQQTVALDSSGTGGGAVLPIMGYPPQIDLTGKEALKTGGISTAFDGQVVMSGNYKGLTSCDFNFEVISSGTLNNGNVGNTPVTVRVSWVDDQGLAHQDDMEFACAGEEFAMEIPGANGLSFYLEPGNYNATPGNPDVFQERIIMSPEHAGEGFFFQLEPGSYQVGDSFFVSLNPNQQHVLDTLQQWCLALQSGDQEFAQTWSQRALDSLKDAQKHILDYVSDSGARQNRIAGRVSVLDGKEILNSETLVALQEIDPETNLLEMQLVLSNYSDVLKVTSSSSDMFLLNYI